MLKCGSKKSVTVLAVVFMTALLTACNEGTSGGTLESAAGGSTNNSTSISLIAKEASLSWNAPATRVNGEGLAMGELQGYVILYGKESDNLSQRVEIASASTMDYIISNLDQGEWFFAIQVIDVNGLVSPPSEIVSKTI
ncbi:MAG: fibronectin type III domain-containing protein [Marinobacter sp.]|uniref:fibronectin type III domain-containing protein n=1 Tax=Marinobacter sp. TaxID=50741 RepID=UPI0034A09536